MIDTLRHHRSPNIPTLKNKSELQLLSHERFDIVTQENVHYYIPRVRSDPITFLQ